MILSKIEKRVDAKGKCDIYVLYLPHKLVELAYGHMTSEDKKICNILQASNQISDLLTMLVIHQKNIEKVYLKNKDKFDQQSNEDITLNPDNQSSKAELGKKYDG